MLVVIGEISWQTIAIKKLTLEIFVGMPFKVLRRIQVLEALCKHCRLHSWFACMTSASLLMESKPWHMILDSHNLKSDGKLLEILWECLWGLSSLK